MRFLAPIRLETSRFIFFLNIYLGLSWVLLFFTVGGFLALMFLFWGGLFFLILSKCSSDLGRTQIKKNLHIVHLSRVFVAGLFLLQAGALLLTPIDCGMIPRSFYFVEKFIFPDDDLCSIGRMGYLQAYLNIALLPFLIGYPVAVVTLVYKVLGKAEPRPGEKQMEIPKKKPVPAR